MKDNVLGLKNAPIVEAVIDIDCDLPVGSSLEALEMRAKELFQDRYPKSQTLFMQAFQVELNAIGPTGQSTQKSVQAFQFLSEDGAQLVQVRSGGFSFNRLQPYTSFDDYLPEIQRTWKLYQALAAPVLVRKLQLRYINRIYLPVENKTVNLDDYFTVGPRLPDGKNLTLVGFLNQYVAIESKTGHQITTVLTAEEMQGDRLPVIFDNAVSAAVAEDAANWASLESKLLSLRELKNRVFQNTLGEPCLNLFR